MVSESFQIRAIKGDAMLDNLGIDSKFFTLLPAQLKCIKQGLATLNKYGCVYYSMQERTGKTLTALVSAFKFKENARVIIYTKKRALAGWQGWIDNPYFKGKDITLINYESNAKLVGRFDIAILDEAHNYISSYPKESKTYKKIFSVVKDCNIIYCSATPCAEGYAKLFNQLHLSKHSPFSYTKFKNFYLWHKIYGIPNEKRINGLLIKDYSKTKDNVIREVVAPFFVTAKRDFAHEPNDILIECDYTKEQLELIKLIMKGGFTNYVIKGKSYSKLIDTKLSELLAIWQVEGGTLICDNGVMMIPTNKTKCLTEKNDVVFCYFQNEKERLSEYKCAIYHYTKHSEGIDLSHYNRAFIYTPTFSATKYSQVRSRLSRFDREKPIEIFWLHNGVNSICYNIYKSVYEKNQKFTLKMFSESQTYNEIREKYKCMRVNFKKR